MEPSEPEKDGDVLYQFALALLELIGKRIDLEVERAGAAEGLALHGTLLRAFEPPFLPDTPTMSIMIGPHCISIRIGGMRGIAFQRRENGELVGIHALLNNGGGLHIKVPPKPGHRR